MIESSKKVGPWREAVKAAFVQTGAEAPRFPGPVRVTIEFLFDPPKDAPKSKKHWPSTRSSGDIDKLLRSTFDALVDSGILVDDAQIVEVYAKKTHVLFEIPGATIVVEQMI
jgi:Holliday junction resolvase RusA-like endonuclease